MSGKAGDPGPDVPPLAIMGSVGHATAGWLCGALGSVGAAGEGVWPELGGFGKSGAGFRDPSKGFLSSGLPTVGLGCSLGGVGPLLMSRVSCVTHSLPCSAALLGLWNTCVTGQGVFALSPH